MGKNTAQGTAAYVVFFLHCCEKEFSLGLAELCLLHLSWWAQDLTTESGKQEEEFLGLFGFFLGGRGEREGVDITKYCHRSWDTGHMTQSFCFLETTLLYVNLPPSIYHQVYPICQDTCLTFSIFVCVDNKY